VTDLHLFIAGPVPSAPAIRLNGAGLWVNGGTLQAFEIETSFVPVGGIGELPDVAGTGGGLARNHVIIAAVTGIIGFGAGAFYAGRRRLG
jgi:hypothetical protein